MYNLRVFLPVCDRVNKWQTGDLLSGGVTARTLRREALSCRRWRKGLVTSSAALARCVQGLTPSFDGIAPLAANLNPGRPLTLILVLNVALT